MFEFLSLRTNTTCKLKKLMNANTVAFLAYSFSQVEKGCLLM